MVTRNFRNLMAMCLQSSANNYGALSIQDVSGAVRYSVGNFTFPASRTVTPTLVAATEGISVGVGLTPAKETDYNLEKTLTSGITIQLTKTSLGVDAPGNPYVEYQITVTNTGSSALTITEVGYKQKLKAALRPGGTSVTDYVFLIDRTVLDAPLVLEGGDAGVLVYKLATAPSGGKTVAGVQIASWTWGTDEQLAAMIDAARAGKLNLQEDAGWCVGDMRTIHIDAFTLPAGTAVAAQNIAIAISSFEEYMGCGNILQFDFYDCVVNSRMNSSNTTTGGYAGTEMYKLTLPAIIEALPEWLKSRLKTFSVLASAGGSNLTTIETVPDNKLALRSEIEVFGTVTNSKAGEGTQVELYKATATRVKSRTPGGSAVAWWERSAYSSTAFCCVGNYGAATSNTASGACGVAPFGCI